MYEKIKKMIKNHESFLEIKFFIIDNINKMSSRQRQNILSIYCEEFGNNELWYLLRGIHNIEQKAQKT